jgi:endonuclease YncB( thermonuclease family)
MNRSFVYRQWLYNITASIQHHFFATKYRQHASENGSGSIGFMRLFTVLAFLLGFSGATLAAQDDQLTGTPAVLPSGLIMIEGKDVALWGIDPLAIDQQCWHEERAWNCGEEALTVLRHFLTGSSARCLIKKDLGAGRYSAQCFRVKGGKEFDIARYLVGQGWARDHKEDTDGLYSVAQTDARLHRRGIWTSKFQTAEDWKNGVQQYVAYKMAPPKAPNPAAATTSGDSKHNPQ